MHKLSRSELHLVLISLQLFHVSHISFHNLVAKHGISLPTASFSQCWPLDFWHRLDCINCSLYVSTQAQRELRQHIKRDISEFTLMLGAALRRDDRRFPSVLHESEGIAWTAAVEHKQKSQRVSLSQNTPGENLKCPDNSPNKSPWQRILQRYVMKESIQVEEEEFSKSRTFLLEIKRSED